MSNTELQADPFFSDDFWKHGFWPVESPPTTQHDSEEKTADSQEFDARVNTPLTDSRPATKPRLRLLPGGKKAPDSSAYKAAVTPTSSNRQPNKPSLKTGSSNGVKAKPVPTAQQSRKRAAAKRQLQGTSLTIKAMQMAWHDKSGGKFTQAFTRVVLKMSPVFVADDALIPLTMGAAAPVSLGTNVVLAIGLAIYSRKVLKYRRQLAADRC